MSTQWKDGREAAPARQRGALTVAAGLQSELEAVQRGSPKFVITSLPSLRAPP